MTTLTLPSCVALLVWMGATGPAIADPRRPEAMPSAADGSSSSRHAPRNFVSDQTVNPGPFEAQFDPTTETWAAIMNSVQQNRHAVALGRRSGLAGGKRAAWHARGRSVQSAGERSPPQGRALGGEWT
jgi:hypothetical protein